MTNLRIRGKGLTTQRKTRPIDMNRRLIRTWIIVLCYLSVGINTAIAQVQVQATPEQVAPENATAPQEAINPIQASGIKGFEEYFVQADTNQGFTTTPLPAHWEDKQRTLTITAPFINLHTFAGRGYPIFHTIEKNETVYLYKRRNDWFKVETQDGKLGWIARNDMDHTINQNNAYLSFGSKGWQDHLDNKFELGLTSGTLDGAIAYTPYFGYHFTPNIQLEVNYTQAFGDYSNLKSASLSIIHKPFPDWRLSPFFKLSSGFIQTNPSTIIVQSVDRQDPLLTVGGGLFFYPSNRLVLRVEYDKHTILTTRDVNEEVEEWKAGFGVLF